jgi:hypothetical protein
VDTLALELTQQSLLLLLQLQTQLDLLVVDGFFLRTKWYNQPNLHEGLKLLLLLVNLLFDLLLLLLDNLISFLLMLLDLHLSFLALSLDAFLHQLLVLTQEFLRIGVLLVDPIQDELRLVAVQFLRFLDDLRIMG